MHALARWVLVTGGFLAVIGLSGSAQARGKNRDSLIAKPAKANKKAVTDEGTDEGDGDKGSKDGIRRDPKGVKGISPFWEALVKGDRAYVARDIDGAIASYTEAIKLEPKNALGHHRQGQGFWKKGDLAKAEEAFMAGLTFASRLNPVRTKLLFGLASLREQQRKLAPAGAAWSEYYKLCKESLAEQEAAAEAKGKDAEKAPKKRDQVKCFLASAESRQNKIAEYQAVDEQAQKVKQRIEENLKEASAPKK